MASGRPQQCGSQYVLGVLYSPFPIPWRVVDGGMKNMAIILLWTSSCYTTKQAKTSELMVSDSGGQPACDASLLCWARVDCNTED